MAIRTVLIADSNVRLAQLLAQLLADEPEFSVLEVCSNADLALQRAREHSPDVVLVSERLSGRAGADVCRDLRGCVPDATLLLWAHDMSRAPEGEPVVDGLLERGLTFRDLARAVRRTRHEAVAATGIPVVRAGERVTPAVAISPTTGAPASPPTGTGRPGTGHMLLSCESCAVEVSIATRDMSAAIAQARVFFAEHADCQTAIDLTRRGSGPRAIRAARRQSTGC